VWFWGCGFGAGEEGDFEGILRTGWGAREKGECGGEGGREVRKAWQ